MSEKILWKYSVIGEELEKIQPESLEVRIQESRKEFLQYFMEKKSGHIPAAICVGIFKSTSEQMSGGLLGEIPVRISVEVSEDFLQKNL